MKMKSLAMHCLIALLPIGYLGSLVYAQENTKTTSDKPAVANLDWLAGSWTTERQRNGAVVATIDEYWQPPKGELMLGVNRTVRADGTTAFEFMRIAATDTSISLFASPNGVAATEFPLQSQTDLKVVFENPHNDFPHRIIYRRSGDMLIGRIEGTIDGQLQSSEWKFVAADN